MALCRLYPPKTCKIDPSVSSVERFLLMTFPLTTRHNVFMDPEFGLISPSATQFATAVWACGGRLL